MNPQQTQSNMTPDESAASLAFATNLNDEILRMQGQANQPTEETAPEIPETAPEDTEAQEADMDAKIEEKVSKVVKEEMKTLKAELKDMLNE